MLNFFIILLLIIIPIILLVKLRHLKESFFINVKYWLILYSYFYILLPSYFLEYTNELQKWNFLGETIIKSKIISIYSTLFILGMSFLIFNDFVIENRNKLLISNFHQKLFGYIWFFLVLISLYVTYKVGVVITSSGITERLLLGDVLEKLSRIYKVKGLLFLSLTISTIQFWNKERYFVFSPMIILSILDILAGGRTFAFFALITIYINIATKNRKIHILKISILLIILLSSVTFARLSVQAVDKSIGKYKSFIYHSLGEFTQVYNTIPYTIQENFLSETKIEDFTVNFISGIFSGTLKLKMDIEVFNAGSELAKKISRGYGLGMSLVAEFYYYGGYIGVMMGLFIMLSLCYLINIYALKLKFPGYVFLIYFIIYTRLFFREGFVAYLLIPLYLFMTYGILSFLFYDKKILEIKRKGWRINAKNKNTN